MRRNRLALLLLPLALTLGACAPLPPVPSVAPATDAPAATMAPPTAAPATVESLPAPRAVEYDLGETTITQARFPEDSRFRNMPVRLNGVIAAPEGAGPFPVVVILHGTHPGCPEDAAGVDRWPCDPALERPNYRGFGYLAERLAANGYVALSININAENTFGFGEPEPGERLAQIVDKHLAALCTASAGGENRFGLALEGKADLAQLALAGHSRGGEQALALARSLVMAGADHQNGYGPVAGILMIAPSPVFADPAEGSPVPLGIIVPLCDADVINQEGQHFFEGARLAPGQAAWITSAFVERANHNFFNATLGDDPFGRQGRPDCAPLLDPNTQQAFLEDYAVDFFDTLFGSASTSEARQARLGLDVSRSAPAELYGLPARVAFLPEADRRTPLFTPAGAAELTTHRLGGPVVADGVTTFFCEAGYYTPLVRPGTEPCRRASVVVPGNPALAVVSWQQPGAALKFAIPEGKGDLRAATALTLRAALDPLSELNPTDRGQAFTVRLTDATGKSAAVRTRPDEPALRFPPGEAIPDASFDQLFTGRVPLSAVRFPLAAFSGVDLSDIREIALVFDQTPSGSLFVADVELVAPAR